MPALSLRFTNISVLHRMSWLQIPHAVPLFPQAWAAFDPQPEPQKSNRLGLAVPTPIRTFFTEFAHSPTSPSPQPVRSEPSTPLLFVLLRFEPPASWARFPLLLLPQVPLPQQPSPLVSVEGDELFKHESLVFTVVAAAAAVVASSAAWRANSSSHCNMNPLMITRMPGTFTELVKLLVKWLVKPLQHEARHIYWVSHVVSQTTATWIHWWSPARHIYWVSQVVSQTTATWSQAPLLS